MGESCEEEEEPHAHTCKARKHNEECRPREEWTEQEPQWRQGPVSREKLCTQRNQQWRSSSVDAMDVCVCAIQQRVNKGITHCHHWQQDNGRRGSARACSGWTVCCCLSMVIGTEVLESFDNHCAKSDNNPMNPKVHVLHEEDNMEEDDEEHCKDVLNCDNKNNVDCRKCNRNN